jgi:hypothetical protein
VSWGSGELWNEHTMKHVKLHRETFAWTCRARLSGPVRRTVRSRDESHVPIPLAAAYSLPRCARTSVSIVLQSYRTRCVDQK